MNKENILAVADAIEGHTIPGLGFNMGNFVGPPRDGEYDLSGHSCGTIACIAGTARVVRTGVIVHVLGSHFHWHQEADWLGLDHDDAHELFFAEGFWNGFTAEPPGGLGGITPAQAVRVLRHLAQTGEVDWSVATSGATSEPTNAR